MVTAWSIRRGRASSRARAHHRHRGAWAQCACRTSRTALPSLGSAAGPLSITQATTRDFTFVRAGCRIGHRELDTVVYVAARTASLTLPETGDVVRAFVNRRESQRTVDIIKNSRTLKLKRSSW
ncbi:MAG: hypothetical protein JXQ99_08610 [Hyphomicrobiaceae bacterium]